MNIDHHIDEVLSDDVTPVPMPAPAASGTTSGGNDHEATAAASRNSNSSYNRLASGVHHGQGEEEGGGAIVMHERRSVDQGSLRGVVGSEPEPEPELEPPGSSPAIIPPPQAPIQDQDQDQAQAEAVLETQTPLLPTTATSPHPAPSQHINSPRPLLSREGRDSDPRCNQNCSKAPSAATHHDSSHHSKMIFSDLYKSPRSPLSKLRHPHLQHHSSSTEHQAPDYDADLVSKDKTKQKEAVKRFLAQKVRTDWDFKWPAHNNPPELPSAEEPNVAETALLPDKDIEGFLEVAIEREDEDITPVADEDAVVDSGEEADSETDSVYSSMSEDPVHYRPRAEWTSDLSDDDHIMLPSSPFRFDNPDSIGAAVKASSMARKAKRRREVRKEMTWNQGLACFEARRNAWTGAKTVHVRPKPPSPESPSSPRRGLFWRTHSNTNRSVMSSGSQAVASPLSPVTTAHSHHSTHSAGQAELSSVPTTSMDDSSSHAHDLSPKTSNSESASQQHPVETLLPIAPPLLPPANPMRASITPALYISIYDKVVVHSLQPSCPINLSDMIRACVTGWKRDGEWPPRPTELPAVIAVRKKKEKRDSVTSPTSTRRMSFGFLNRGDKDEKDKEKDKAGEKSGEGRRESVAEDGSAGKAFRRSIQKVLGIGHGHASATPPVANGNNVQGKEGGGGAA